MNEAQYPIQLVARLTGLSAHVIRIWEQRYRAVEPQRTATKRRLYSQREIERLNLLRDVTHAGHSIGQVAQLPTDKLGKLVAASPSLHGSRPARCGPGAQARFVPRRMRGCRSNRSTRTPWTTRSNAEPPRWAPWACCSASSRLWLRPSATCGATALSPPLTNISPARRFGFSWATPPSRSARWTHAPVLVVATPAGQVHELGALLVGATAANLGWQVTYLGASLPAAEIAGAAQQRRARAVALSLVYPEDDPGWTAS